MANPPSRRRIQQLTQRAKEGPASLLHETIRYLKADDAASIIHAGLSRQLRYIRENLGIDRAEEVVDELLDEHSAVASLVDDLREEGRLTALHHAVYKAKTEEAAQLTSHGFTEQVRYLVARYGLAKTLRLFDKSPQ
jgi:hypothetical protein